MIWCQSKRGLALSLVLTAVICSGCAGMQPLIRPRPLAREVGVRRGPWVIPAYGVRRGPRPGWRTAAALSPEELVERLKAVVAENGLELVYWRRCPENMLGEYDGRRILLCPRDAFGEAETLFHELGHHEVRLVVGQNLSKAENEYIAEGVRISGMRAAGFYSNDEFPVPLTVRVGWGESAGLLTLAAHISDRVLRRVYGTIDVRRVDEG